jgi:hypothetical protein
MDRKETVEKIANLRSDTWEKTFPKINAVLNTETGRGLIEEDLNRFQTLYSKILGGDFEDIKIDDFVEIKFLQKRILILTKRIAEYLKLAEK